MSEVEKAKITRRKYLKYGGAVVAVGVAAAAGYGIYEATKPPVKKEIVIGGTLPLTGICAMDGQRILRATELAVNRINEEGGVLGKKLRLIVYDDTMAAEKIGPLYEKLIATDKVDILITPYGAPMAFPALTVCEKYDKIMIAGFVASTSPAQRFGGKNGFFAHCMPRPTYSSFYYSIFTDMLNDFDKWNYKKEFTLDKTVASINENQLWGIEQHEIWKPMAEKQGWNMVLDEFVDITAVEFSSTLAKIKLTKPFLILAEFFFFRCVILLKQMIEQGVSAPFVVLGEAGTSYDWIDPEKGVGPVGNGIFTINLFPKDYRGGDSEYLRAKYKELYGTIPSAHEVTGYSSIEIIRDAVEKAGSLESDALRKVLLTEEFDTCFTRVKFDKEGCNTLWEPTAGQWQNNVIETVWPPKRATAKPIYPYSP